MRSLKIMVPAHVWKNTKGLDDTFDIESEEEAIKQYDNVNNPQHEDYDIEEATFSKGMEKAFAELTVEVLSELSERLKKHNLLTPEEVNAEIEKLKFNLKMQLEE